VSGAGLGRDNRRRGTQSGTADSTGNSSAEVGSAREGSEEEEVFLRNFFRRGRSSTSRLRFLDVAVGKGNETNLYRG
jgi:hypothetical protein